jgi:transcriptional repressor NrdR
MRCPYCGHPEDKVIDSRESKEGDSIRRRRECLECEKRFTTYEHLEDIELVVVKKDGRREQFSREKLLNGIKTACEKTSVTTEQFDHVVNEIMQKLLTQWEREVPSNEIGELVMGELRKLDKVAYVRFASVYRQFKDTDEFLNELQTLLSKSDGKKLVKKAVEKNK